MSVAQFVDFKWTERGGNLWQGNPRFSDSNPSQIPVCQITVQNMEHRMTTCRKISARWKTQHAKIDKPRLTLQL